MPDFSRPLYKRALAVLVLVALVVRVGFFLENAGSPFFAVPILDEKYYDTVAKMLVAGEDLRELHGFRPLLYPLFLALFYKFSSSGAEIALFVQHLLGVVTVLIVALLGTQLFRNRLCGILSGFLYLLSPVPLYFEGELLIESSYTFLICAGLLLHLHASDRSGWKSGVLWLLCGSMVVLAAQARANILVFLAVYPLVALWRWRSRRNATAFIPLLGILGAFAMMIPWGFVNMKQSDHFHLIPNAGGVNFYLGNKRGADGMLVGQDVIDSLSKLSLDASSKENVPPQYQIRSGDRYQDLVEVWAREEYERATRAQGGQPTSDPMAISEFWSERAKEEIRSDPGAWVKLLVKKSWLMLWNEEIPNNKSFAFLQDDYFWLRALPVRWVVLLVLAPVGCWAAVRSGNRNALFILLVYALLYSAGNVAFFICDRYRYPVWPAMAVFAGGGLLMLIDTLRRGQIRRLLGVSIVMALFAALSLHNWFDAKLPNFAQDFYFRSAAWYEKGRFPESLTDIDRSLALDPLRADALHHRGNVLFALNRFDDARAAYEATLKLIPGDSSVWNNLGATLDALGATEPALEALRRAVECTLPSRNAFLGMAHIQIRLGRFTEAEKSLAQMDKHFSDPDGLALATRAVLARQHGNDAEASILEQRAKALNPSALPWVLERVFNTRETP